MRTERCSHVSSVTSLHAQQCKEHIFHSTSNILNSTVRCLCTNIRNAVQQINAHPAIVAAATATTVATATAAAAPVATVATTAAAAAAVATAAAALVTTTAAAATTVAAATALIATATATLKIAARGATGHRGQAGGTHTQQRVNQPGRSASSWLHPALAPQPAANKTMERHFPASSQQRKARMQVYIPIHTALPTSRRGLSSRGARKDCSPSMPPSKRGRRSKRSPPSRSPKRGVRGLSPRGGGGERQSPSHKQNQNPKTLKRWACAPDPHVPPVQGQLRRVKRGHVLRLGIASVRLVAIGASPAAQQRRRADTPRTWSSTLQAML
ncbi:hypothetical protein ACK3TF_000890 [Chlorella vulgaris]